jgi:hypothetical protein
VETITLWDLAGAAALIAFAAGMLTGPEQILYFVDPQYESNSDNRQAGHLWQLFKSCDVGLEQQRKG